MLSYLVGTCLCLYLFCAYLISIIICAYISDIYSGKEDTQRQPFGVYLQAFCNGLNEVLVPYRKDIADQEGKSLADPYLPLLTVVSKVEEYAKLFEVLNYMIKQVRRFCIMSVCTSWPLFSCAFIKPSYHAVWHSLFRFSVPIVQYVF
jgi:hypothetical protein